MILIDKRIEKVLDGFDWIRLLEKDLVPTWRDQLRAAYTRRFNAYVEKRDRYRERKEMLQARQPLLILETAARARTCQSRL